MRINPALSGKLTLVADGRPSSPALSGNGEVVVYNELVDDNLEIMRYRDGETVRLTHDPRGEMHARLSHDGRTIVWNRYSSADPRDSEGHWDVVRWRDGQVEEVAATDKQELSPDISADGEVIVWDQNRGDRSFKRDIGRWENGRTEVLTSEGSNAFADVSGDGRRAIRKNDGALWLRDQNGTVKPFVKTEGTIIAADLDHTGETVVFSSKKDGEEDLYLLHEPSGRLEVLAEDARVHETSVAVSGNGETVAWMSYDFRQGTPASVDLFLKEGREEPVQVTLESHGLNIDPQLSADGKTLVWTWVDDKDWNHRKIYKLAL